MDSKGVVVDEREFFGSAKEAARAYGGTESGVCDCIAGRMRTHRGHTFRRATEYESAIASGVIAPFCIPSIECAAAVANAALQASKSPMTWEEVGRICWPALEEIRNMAKRWRDDV
jgi:hypothetical protein